MATERTAVENQSIPGMRKKQTLFSIFQRLNYQAKFIESHVFIHVHVYYIIFMAYQFNWVLFLSAVYNEKRKKKNLPLNFINFDKIHSDVLCLYEFCQMIEHIYRKGSGHKMNCQVTS